jgi:hypothetical protein
LQEEKAYNLERDALEICRNALLVTGFLETGEALLEFREDTA